MSTADLCLALMRADTEDQVVDLLASAGYWDDPAAWRYLGDTENNFGVIGSQQSESVAALIEKLVNGVDARLLNACRIADIDPTSSEAPASIRHAVAHFFEEHSAALPPDFGSIALWPDAKATSEADQLTLTATGHGPKSGAGLPCLTVADSGEGQTPDDFPSTFLSLQKSNKLRVQFVQGKFNMGSTGALRFCSPLHRFQLILSRRNPALLRSPTSRQLEWGFTVVRREPPSRGTRSSVFSYLAPLDVSAGRDGQVLSFAAGTMPIFPRADKEGRDAYSRESTHGSLVKLYEYHLDGRSNIVRSGGGLLQRVDFGMPELALPIRLYECRDSYRGHSGSFATNVLGVVSRLDRDRYDKLEDGFPVGHVLRLEGRDIRIRAYALKGSAREYRSGSSAIVFSINGQTHATKTLEFFRRRNVGMSQLADSLIVVVDCTAIEGQLREDLFMNSRDRLSGIELGSRLEAGIEKFLHDDPALRALKNRRREQEIAEKLDDARPLADALTDLVKQTPGLSQLLVGGRSVPSPFPKAGATADGAGASTFSGKRFPTFFRFKNKADGETLKRVAHQGSTTRLKFETDAEDDYFEREAERGAFEVELFDSTSGVWEPLREFSFTRPSSGIAGLTFELPPDAEIDDEVRLRIMVTDPSRIDAFLMEAHLRVAGPSSSPPGTTGKDRKNNVGKGKGSDAGSVALPNIIPVRRNEWENHGFDELSALKAVGQGADDDGLAVFDFYVNYDNKYLLTAQKDPKRDAEALRAQFVYSLVLFSMSLLIEERSKKSSATPPLAADGDIEVVVGAVARRLAPFVLPTLEAMRALSE